MGCSTYYETLGVAHGDSSRFIHDAFRDLMRACYPERTPRPGTPFCASVVRAFDVLSDGTSRSAYDTELQQPGEPPVSEPVDQWQLSLLDDFEGIRPTRAEVMDRMRRNFTRRGLPKSCRARPLELHVAMPTPEQESALAVSFPTFHPCPICHGAGHDGEFPCRDCDQEGLQRAHAVARFRIPRGARGLAVCERSLSSAGVNNVVLRVRLCVGH